MRNTTAPGANKPKKAALIDADGILYATALRSETVCDGEQLQMVPAAQAAKQAMDRIEEQADWVDADEVFICLSDRRNFRYDILPAGHHGSMGCLGYKGNRKATARPLLLDSLRTFFAQESTRYRTILVDGLEADDVCGIYSGHLRAAGYEPIIISPDKDLLQIPGLVCTPLPNGKHPISEVTKQAADRWHMTQTLTGDTCDGYKGCPGIGPRKAGDLLDYCEAEGFTAARAWGEVIDQFLAAGLTQEDCLVQARVSRILRSGDWDIKRKKPILFEFPVERMGGLFVNPLKGIGGEPGVEEMEDAA